MTFGEVIQAGWPNADKNTMDYILWNRTPYPFDLSPKGLYKSANRAYRADKNNIRLCSMCDRRAEHRKDLCPRCNKVLEDLKKQESENDSIRI